MKRMHGNHSRRIWNGPLAGLLWALLAAAVLAGCSHMSVRHLQRNPWTLGQPGQVGLRFLRFNYTVAPVEGGYRVQGTAVPTANLPERARWAEELWLATYLANAKGKVLAQDTRTLTDLPLRPDGVPFSFVLEALGSAASVNGPFFITFGYQVSASEHPPGQQPTGPDGETGEAVPANVFFASESAITKY